MNETSCFALGAMPHIQRLRAFCALVAAGPEGLTPSVLADQLDVARNSLSFYLKELVHGRSKSHGCVRTARALGYVRLITYTLRVRAAPACAWPAGVWSG